MLGEAMGTVWLGVALVVLGGILIALCRDKKGR